MGIKNLNRFLRENCTKKSIRKVNLKQFANKIIVIDTSIYLYKFASDNALLENMYLLISIMKSYQITPIFIFDGKPPPEKKELLYRRRLEKKEAESKYLNLQSLIPTISGEDKKEMIMEMELLKRQFIRISQDDIRKVKELMEAYGVSYYDSPTESDELCSYLVKSDKAWACLSDDMDMFLYGCPYVIRHLSLMNHTVVLYDTKSILKDLEMNETQFCEIMVLSGTDYNLHSNTSLTETIKWFYEYNKYVSNFNKNSNKSPLGFYIWLVKNTKYVNDFYKLLRTLQMFQINNDFNLKCWKEIELMEKNENMDKLKEILKGDGFIFVTPTGKINETK